MGSKLKKFEEYVVQDMNNLPGQSRYWLMPKYSVLMPK